MFLYSIVLFVALLPNIIKYYAEEMTFLNRLNYCYSYLSSWIRTRDQTQGLCNCENKTNSIQDEPYSDPEFEELVHDMRSWLNMEAVLFAIQAVCCVIVAYYLVLCLTACVGFQTGVENLYIARHQEQLLLEQLENTRKTPQKVPKQKTTRRRIIKATTEQEISHQRDQERETEQQLGESDINGLNQEIFQQQQEISKQRRTRRKT